MAEGNVEVCLKNVRLSFAHVFKPQKSKDGKGDPKFNCSFLLDKSTKTGKENIAAMKEAMREVREAKWGDNPPKLKAEKMCLRDGDNEDWDGYAGMMYVSASNKRRPTVIDRDKTPLTEEDGVIYSGCHVHGIVRVWAQDNEHGKRINASLEGIKFVKDGEAFGAAPLSEDAFDAFDDDDDEGEDDAPRRKGKSRSRDDGDGDGDEDDAPRRAKGKPAGKPKAKSRSRDDEDDDDDDDLLG